MGCSGFKHGCDMQQTKIGAKINHIFQFFVKYQRINWLGFYMKLTHVKHIVLKTLQIPIHQISYKPSWMDKLVKNVCFVVNYEIILHQLKTDLLFVKS
jgi:hypothetical protein